MAGGLSCKRGSAFFSLLTASYFATTFVEVCIKCQKFDGVVKLTTVCRKVTLPSD